MPRDDLSIDFVKRMPQAEALDPGTILEEFIDRTRNLPDEIKFLLDEIADRDATYNTYLKTIEDRENRIQKWIKANGSHTPNPREAAHRDTIRDCYVKAQKLSDEKVALYQKMQLNYDKHIRHLDTHLKSLHDRNEPGFQDPDELPSLLRPSAANHSAPSARSINPAATDIAAASVPVPATATPAAARANNPQIRINTNQPAHAASAPATPAASMIMNRQRESSAGPGSGAPKRGPRANTGLGTQPATSSNLARHSSVGPGTPKAAAVTGPQRAGSAGPRATAKGTSTGPGRKAGTPGAIGRKKVPGGTNKSGLARMKRPAKNSPSSTAESELSEAESASESAASSRRGTPARTGASQSTEKESQTQTHPKTKRASAVTAGDDDEDAMDVDDDDAGDDKKYCLCQNVSFGDMVACDNDDCPYEWFHWSCVGLKSEPNGTWYCPVCSAKLDKTEKVGATKKGK